MLSLTHTHTLVPKQSVGHRSVPQHLRAYIYLKTFNIKNRVERRRDCVSNNGANHERR